jgi:E3 ubiquitin-protein ligase BAH
VSTDGPVLRQIEIPLTFDAEFFELLQDDVSHLDAIQAAERKTLTNDILELSKEITALVKPSRFNKTDMYVWRELFDIYLQAGVFFSTTELHTGSRSPASAARQLDWFQNEVNSRALVASFKLRASHRALDQFVKINITLLRNLKFQEINEIAIRKILKSAYTTLELGCGLTNS